ncbi:SDR family oxidoreductase [Acuticoccus sp.]|uniref:SDR family oxidoreductase n=1 Tax=Acuticoccus sp. TaxID=1904378 RepID=UPI003B518262
METVLVTGVSRGIGAAIAARCAADGLNVVGIARTRPNDFAGDFRAIDLSGPDARGALAAIAEEVAPTRLVANAGLVRAETLDATTDDGFEATMRLNVQSVIWAMQAVTPAMRAARFGRVVLIGSRAALGKTERITYSASKAALGGIARSAALELAADGITVNVVGPGPIETELFRINQPEGSPAREALLADVPMGRLGAPEEVAAAVAFFLSADAGFVTGQTLYVCGGLSVGPAR